MNLRWQTFLLAGCSAIGIIMANSFGAFSEPSVLPSKPSSHSAQRSAYEVLPLTTFKGSLVSGDPSQLPLIVLNSSFGKQQSVPKVEFDRTNPIQIVAWVTYLGLEDDSVKGIRYRFEMVPASVLCACQSWKVSWAGRQYQCQSGRGTQDWSAQLCR